MICTELAPAAATDALREAIEHVMRVSDDDADIAVLLSSCGLGDRRLQALVGRLTARTRVPVLPGSPLAALVTGEPVRAGWRVGCPPAPGSLFREWMFLHELSTGTPLAELDRVPPAPAGDVYGHLERLRAQFAA